VCGNKQNNMESTKQRKSLFFGYVLGCATLYAFLQCASGVPPPAVILDSKAPPPSRSWNHSVVLPRDDPPHAGSCCALDENGTCHVPDVTAVREQAVQTAARLNIHDLRLYWPRPENCTACQDPPGMGFEGMNGYKALRNHVQVDGPDPLPEPDKALISEEWWATRIGHANRHADRPHLSLSPPPHRTAVPPPRILCSVYTHAPRHGNIKDIVDTWGWRCDGFLAASNKTDRSIGAVHLLHAGEETYNNMWQKTRSMVAFLYDYYLDYDYFLLCGDDTFIVLENLRNYLLLLEYETGGRHRQPLYLGLALSLWGVHYNSGGPGYILSRLALQRLVQDGLDYFYTNTVISGEDAVMGRLMTVLHVPVVDTSDAANRQRFFHNSLNQVGSNDYLDLYSSFTFDHGNRTARNTISTQSIGFHMVTSMHRFAAILYNACPRGSVLGDAQESTVPAVDAAATAVP
jgi:hypothetical protein